MTCGYLLQLTTHFKALTEQGSNLTQMIPEETTIPFLRTAVGHSTNQDVPDKAVIFPTHVASAEGHTPPSSAPSNRIDQDLTYKVHKGGQVQQQVAESHNMGVRVPVSRGDRVSLVTPIKIKEFGKWIKGFEFQDYLVQGFREGFRIGF